MSKRAASPILFTLLTVSGASFVACGSDATSGFGDAAIDGRGGSSPSRDAAGGRDATFRMDGGKDGPSDARPPSTDAARETAADAPSDTATPPDAHPDAAPDATVTTDAGLDAPPAPDARVTTDAAHDAHGGSCMHDSDCAGPTTDCQHPTCTGGSCTTTFTPANTATVTTPPQTPGDCQRIVCDGMGNTKSVADDTNLPSSGTVCITGGCTNGMATQTINTGTTCQATACQGTTLDRGSQCSGTGSCVAASPATENCAPYGCGGTPAACLTSCMIDTDCASAADYCTGAHTCASKLTNGSVCTAVDQCESNFCVTGFCCNNACAGSSCVACAGALTGKANGTCGPVSTGTTCNDGNPCTSNDSCSAGMCTGTPCSTGVCGSTLSAFTGTQTAGWSLNGSAAYDPTANTVVLVDGLTTAEAGTVIYGDPITTDAFTAVFDFRFTTTNGRADGLVFMIEQNGKTALGSGFGGFGALGLTGYGVELDIFDSGPCDPGNGNHAGIDLLSACGTNSGILSAIATSGDLFDAVLPGNGVGDVGDGAWRTATCTFNAGAMSVAIKSSGGGAVTVANLQNVTLPGFVSGTPYYFGFGGGSGSNGQASREEIRNVQITFDSARCL